MKPGPGWLRAWPCAALLLASVSSAAPLAGEMYLSRRQPDQCLGVAALVEPGTPLRLLACDAADTAQRWSAQGGSLRLAGSDWCVEVASRAGATQPLLQVCTAGNAQQQWRYKDEAWQNGSRVLDLTGTDELTLWSPHGGANQRWAAAGEMRDRALREQATVVSYPIAVSDSAALAIENQRDAVNRLAPLDQPLPFPRNVASFPGEVADSVPRVTAEFKLDRRVRKLSHPGWTPGWRQTLHTGLWAPAGAVIRVETTGNAEAVQGVYLRIGTHSDVLRTDGQPVNNDKQLRRFASVSTTKPLKPGLVELRSQYGGFVVIESPTYADAELGLRISGAIQGAYFDTARDQLADWNAIRARPSPWVTIEGRRAVITVPKDQVAALDDPLALMAHYDRHVERHEWLAGLDGEGAAHPRQAPLKQHLMWDPQITAGYAHAGYPIMATSTWRLAVPEKARTDWGNVHEIGHNYQQFALWCTAFGSESTVNLFSLHALEQEGEVSRLVKQGQFKTAVNKLAAGRMKNFADDADVWEKLVFMMQLKAAFPEQGWSMFRQLFRAYRELPESEQRAIIASKQLQYDKNYELLSGITGHNLESHYLQWGVPLSDAARARVKAKGLPTPSVQTWTLVPER